MISTIGLLAKGNEEMVPFAYKSYQNYENGIGKFKTAKEHQDWMDSFSETFCRPDVKVHFLGLFDTVNSVGVFDIPFTTKTYLPTVLRTAHHIRHAVAIDERRCKFKVALLQQDIKDIKDDQYHKEDIKEVYFAGNHGDVGGGWLAEGKKDVDEADDPVQLSDVPLEWMVNELRELPAKHPEERLVFNKHIDIFLNNIHRKELEASTAHMHDTLKFGGGESVMLVLFWNFLGESVELFDVGLKSPKSIVSIQIIIYARNSLTVAIATLEWLPFFKRLELIRGKWVSITFPPNMGDTRDIPNGAVIHPSVKTRMSKTSYLPKNLGLEYLGRR